MATAFAPLGEMAGPSAINVRGPGASFARNTGLFAEHVARSTDVPDSCVKATNVWVRASCFQDTRGVFAVYQSMADAWNAWQTGDTIPTVPITHFKAGFSHEERPLSSIKQTSRAISFSIEQYGWYGWKFGPKVVEDNKRLHWIRCHDGPCILAGY